MIKVWIPKQKNIDTLDHVMIIFGIDLELKNAILSVRRQADLVLIRRDIALYLRNQGLSYPRIGKIMNRDHSSIQHLVKYYTPNARHFEREGGRNDQTSKDGRLYHEKKSGHPAAL